MAAFLDYAQGRNVFVDPARVRSPKDKARVENQVPFVRESWFDGEKFTGLAHARESAAHWCREIAGTRVHGTTRKIPREVFESFEKPEMKPAPDTIYDVPVWIEKAKVHPDHHIQVASRADGICRRFHLALKFRKALVRETDSEYLQRRASPAGPDAHLMHRLNLLVLPDRVNIGEHGVQSFLRYGDRKFA